MPREDPKLFAIYEDPCDRIPTPGTEAARIRDLRAQIEATRLAISERDELLAEAAHVLTSARDKTAHSQVTEAVEIVERARIDRLIKKHKNITAELEMQVKAVETEMEDLTRAIEKREKVVEALEEERENLRKKIKGLLDKQTSLEQQIEGLTIEEEEGFEE